MFAVITDGSHQYRVSAGDELTIDYRKGSEPGQTIEFDRVLLANGGGASAIGQPVIDGATVYDDAYRAGITPSCNVQVLSMRSETPNCKHSSLACTSVYVYVDIKWSIGISDRRLTFLLHSSKLYYKPLGSCGKSLLHVWYFLLHNRVTA